MGRPGDLYGPPIREASSRGGSGRFNWEEVKKDEKFRDTYLGHSVMAPVGRWQKGKDLTWYAKADPTSAQQQREARAAEIRKIKEAEEEALAEALGFKVERKERGEGVTKEEVEAALRDEDGGGMDTVQGLGYGRYGNFEAETVIDGSAKPRIGATLPDGSVMQDHPAPETSRNGVSVDVDAAIKLEDEESVEVKTEEKERRRHRHHHRRHEEDEGRRHKHRHHRGDDERRERRERSRSPHSRRERDHDQERRSDRRRDTERDRGSDRDRGRDSTHDRKRDGGSPRDSYRERRDHDKRDQSPRDREEGRRRRERSRSRGR
jgi:hypothetical protein